MTDRQKEMLTKKALYEFLCDYPEVSMDDIYEYGLIERIKVLNRSETYEISHRILFVRTLAPDERRIFYIPKERFKVEEEKKDV